MIQRKLLSILLCAFLFMSALCFPVEAETYTDEDITYTYELTGEDTAKLVSVTGVNPKGGFTIPREVDGYTVTAIGYGFLAEAYNDLASLSIPNTVTQIDPGFLFGVKLSNVHTGQNDILLQLEEGNPAYTYYFADGVGCLVENDTGRMIAVPEKRNKTLAIPSQVKILGAAALEGLSIHTLYLPASLEEIEPGALDAAEEIQWLEVEDGAAFVIQGKKLLDTEGNVVFPEEKEADPTESYTTADGLTVTPMTQEQKQQLQEKERKNRWTNGLLYGVAALLVLSVMLVIVQTIRGEGPMHLASLFEQPPLFFFDMVLCVSILLLPQMLEEESFWLAGNKLAQALTVIAVVMGIVGVIVEFFHIGIVWAIPRLLVKAIFVVVLAALSLTENFFAIVPIVVVAWRVFTNAARGAWSIFCGLGLAPVLEVMGNVADMMTETTSTILTPQTELREMQYKDGTGMRRYFMGPNGMVSVKEESYSDTVQVSYDGRTFKGTKLSDGSFLLDEPLYKAQIPTTSSKTRKKLTPQECIQFILIGAGMLAPSILILLKFIESMF